jgi:hypothetical protein
MIRCMLHTQLGVFLLYGMISGVAISYYIGYECKEARSQATAEILMQLPFKDLSDLNI